MSREVYADYMRQGPSADDGRGLPDAGDWTDPGTAPAEGGRPQQVPSTEDPHENGNPVDQAKDTTGSSLCGERPDKSSEGSRAGHPDLHDRYPDDYKLAADAVPPRIEGPHDSPDKWPDAINQPGMTSPGRSAAFCMMACLTGRRHPDCTTCVTQWPSCHSRRCTSRPRPEG
jgi:hypothetical protein